MVSGVALKVVENVIPRNSKMVPIAITFFIVTPSFFRTNDKRYSYTKLTDHYPYRP